MIRPAALAMTAVLIVACENRAVSPEARLDATVSPQEDPSTGVPGAAIAVWLDGEIVWSYAAGTAVFGDDGVTATRPLTPRSPVRAASISKLATALTAHSLAEDGVIDMDADVTERLGFDLPVQRSGAPVTMKALLSHTSGICDPDVYWAAEGDTLQSLLTEDARCPYAPGEGWTYANINYGIAAQVMEVAAGERFDQLATTHVLEPLGLDAGFNWSGVSQDKREAGATLYRWIEGRWVAQVDDAETLGDTRPAILRNEANEAALSAGFDNGTLYSPQGGLRASVEDLAVLASAFLPGGRGEALGEPVWTGNEVPGVRAYGPGPQVLLFGQIESRPELRLVGHAGEAYGLYGGAWAIPSRNAAVAFFITGVNPDSDLSRNRPSGFTRYEAELMEIALDVLDSQGFTD